MTFVKYTNDGKVIIQDAALFLSGLDGEEMLEMHLRENAIVLMKPEMPYMEKLLTLRDLTHLIGEMTLDLMPEMKGPGGPGKDSKDAGPIPAGARQATGVLDEDTTIYTPKNTESEDCGDLGYNACDDTVPIPVEALEAAGIMGEDLLIQSVDGAVVIFPEKMCKSAQHGGADA